MRRCFVFFALAAVACAAQLGHGQEAVPAGPQKIAATNIAPLPPFPPSPIDFFRQLLAMPPAEREKILAAKTPERRQALETKLREYEQMDSAEREVRLRGLNLRYYLLPLMRTPASNRTERLVSIPVADRQLVEDRLRLWDQQPKEVQNEFLDNQQYLRILSGTQTNVLPLPQGHEVEKILERWNALPEEKQHRIREDFRAYFDLNEREKEKTLNVFSAGERQQMERTLQVLARLPAAQRERCISGFEKFTELSPEERQEFLRNARRWQEMSSKDRQVWRALVPTLSAPMPPLPPPPHKSFPSVPSRVPALATNQYQ
jgi:Protein of unknown function (DUF3106)